MTITKKWVHSKYWDVTGTGPASGTVKFAIDPFVDDSFDDETIVPGSLTVTLGHEGAPGPGEILLQLRINDDPHENPTNTAWSVTETIDGKARARLVQILSTNPRGDSPDDPINLQDLGDAVENPEYAAYASAALLLAYGKGFVNHGDVAETERPEGFASVEWFGSVEPDNWIDGDTWVQP